MVWLVDGALKFQPNMPSLFSAMIAQAGDAQPAPLRPWFAFWSKLVTVNPAFFVYIVGVFEVTLAVSLIPGGHAKLPMTVG